MQYVEMLLALRHHTVVGSDREQHQVDAVRASQHVADETLVAGDIDHAGARAVGQGEVGEAEIDRNPALFLFLEAVVVLAAERLDQRGFTVIDMAGGADNGMGDAVASDSGGHSTKQKLTPRATAAKRAGIRDSVENRPGEGTANRCARLMLGRGSAIPIGVGAVWVPRAAVWSCLDQIMSESNRTPYVRAALPA